MSADKTEVSTITLQNITYPRIFISLASALVASLTEEGAGLFVVNESGEVERVPKDAVTFIQPPMLLVDPTDVVEWDEENGRIVVNADDVHILKTLAVVSQEQEDEG